MAFWQRPCKDCSKALERAEHAERAAASLQTSYAELEDKVYRWMQRTNQVVRRESASAEPPASTGGTVGSEYGGTGNNPTPFVHPALARIQERRARARHALQERMNGVSPVLPAQG
jgi:hypothetical protein